MKKLNINFAISLSLLCCPQWSFADLAPNQIAVRIDRASSHHAKPTAPAGTNPMTANLPLVSVTICEPGNKPPSDHCETVDNILLDSGSAGLGIYSSALKKLHLPSVKTADNMNIYTCKTFADDHSFWGGIYYADIHMGNEVAPNTRMQIYEVNDLATNAGCKNPIANKLEDDGTNGILGVDVSAANECVRYNDTDCVNNKYNFYLKCDDKNCTQIKNNKDAAAVAVGAPMLNFQKLGDGRADNNGFILEFPKVDKDMQSVVGTLTFGIDTKTNNRLTNDIVNKLTPYYSWTKATYKGKEYSVVLDTGSWPIVVPDAEFPGIPACGPNGLACPAEPINLQMILGNTAPKAPISLVLEATPQADDNMAVLPKAVGIGDNFTLGIPFFLGRKVYFSADQFVAF